jgi:hypothetical protein
MTNEERLNLIEEIVKKVNAKRKMTTCSRPIKSLYAPLEPATPSHHDINEELGYLTEYKAESYINYEEE